MTAKLHLIVIGNRRANLERFQKKASQRLQQRTYMTRVPNEKQQGALIQVALWVITVNAVSGCIANRY